MNRELEQLKIDVASLSEQLGLLAQHIAVIHAREQVDDAMRSALILTHPNRRALRSEWRKWSARIIPHLIVGGVSAWSEEITEDFRQVVKARVEHLNELTDAAEVESPPL